MLIDSDHRVGVMKNSRFQITSTAAALVVGVLSSPSATAEYQISLKVPDFFGDNCIDKCVTDLLSWSWGMSQGKASPNMQSPQYGAACIEDIGITKYIDETTGAIIMASAVGKQLSTATLLVQDIDDQGLIRESLEIDMYNVLISSYKVGNPDNEHAPTEHIEMNFDKIKAVYKANDDGGGSITDTWSVDKGKGACD